ncbi:hypothetical protein [Cyclonatronum proteinivorum]|nr:hypothetical protein [Cyclonatronum proteinivorum]
MGVLPVQAAEPASPDPSTPPSLRYGCAQEDSGTSNKPGAAGRAA